MLNVYFTNKAFSGYMYILLVYPKWHWDILFHTNILWQAETVRSWIGEERREAEISSLILIRLLKCINSLDKSDSNESHSHV